MALTASRRASVRLTIACALLVAALPASAQGTRADYVRSAGLRALTQNRVFKARVQPHWIQSSDRFWYRNDLSGGRREFVLVDAAAGTRKPAFDHTRLADALSKALRKPVTADKLPVDGIDFRDGVAGMLLFVGKTAWELDPKAYALTERKDITPPTVSLPAGSRPRPSVRTGPETTLSFVNVTSGNVDLFWIDSEGQRRKYTTIQPGSRFEQHTFAGHVWLATDSTGRNLGVFEATEDPGVAVIGGAPVERRPSRSEQPEHRPDGTPSPDGSRSAFIKDDNVWLRDKAGGDPVALTTDGSAVDSYGDLYWSPDGRHLVALKTKAGEDHLVYEVESSPTDQVQPKLRTLHYLKPGDRIPIISPHLFNVAERREISIADALFPNPWEISDVRWEPDSRRFTFLYNQRGHQVGRIVAVDANTGSAQAIVDEESKTFIDYAGKRFAYYLESTHEILWMSERDGWNHLYLYDAQTGKVKNQVTSGEWVVRGVDRVDPEKRQVWFRASGIVPGQDPYYVYYCRTNLDGSDPAVLTGGDGTHSVSYSPDSAFLIDTYSRVDLPPVTDLRRTADGRLVCRLERADASALLATGWNPPIRFSAKGRDGRTDIHGIIVRPIKFDPKKRYPVIESIYAGPQDSYVPKAWSSFYGTQELAELGFVVVQIDGMGTSNRSKAFHDVCWRNLADAGFPDRILWMRAAAKKHPWMDLSRVGIYGTSAGGQSALGGLLLHGDFYKAGVADCGCHDNRMDKIWWNELWMGWPVGPWYAAQSNVTLAPQLKGKLLLMVGELDNNVDPASTMQVVNALIQANKDFDLLVVPGAGHGVIGTPYGKRRLEDFFVRALLGVEPRIRP